MQLAIIGTTAIFLQLSCILKSQYKLLIKEGKDKNTMDVLIWKEENKENSNCTLHKELQRLRIELNDRIFEITKMEEDHAHEKAKQFMDFQKERQNLNRTIKELKDKLQVQSQQWLIKVQQIRQKSEEDAQTIKLQCLQSIKQSQIIIKQQAFRQFQQTIALLQKEKTDNERTHQTHVALIQAQKQHQIALLSKSNQQILESKDQTHHATLQALKSQHEKMTTALQQIYLNEKNAKQALQMEVKAHIQSNGRQKLAYEHRIDELQQYNSTLQRQISELQQQVAHLHANIASAQQKNQQSINELTAVNATQIKDLEHNFTILISAQASAHQNHIATIKAHLQQICSTHQQKQRKWEERGQALLNTISNQEIKTSIKKMQTLQWQLIKKQDLLQRQRQSVRNCKLQLQNMQHIYDKMFGTNNYLYKFRSKSFKLKKIRRNSQLQQAIYTEPDN